MRFILNINYFIISYILLFLNKNCIRNFLPSSHFNNNNSCFLTLYYIILYYIISYYIILYYIILWGPPACMQSVVDQTVVMRCIPALSVCLFVSHSVVTAHTYHLDCSDIRPWVRLACLLTLERVLQETPRHSTCPQRYC